MRSYRSETRKRRTMIKWESLNSDLLLHIFLRLEPLFLLSTVAFVCRPWGRLCFSRFLTKDGEKTLDLGGLKCDRSGFLFPTGPYGRIGTAGLMKLIRAVMDVYSCDDYDRVDDGDGTRVTPFTKMVFPFGPFVWSDAHLVYVAERYVILFYPCYGRLLLANYSCSERILNPKLNELINLYRYPNGLILFKAR